MKLVLPLLVLIVSVTGLPMRELPVSLSRKAIQQFNQLTDKLNGLNFKKVRDTHLESGSQLTRAVKELADKTHGMIDAVTKREEAKNALSKKENQLGNEISRAFDNLAVNKKDLQNAWLMKKDDFNKQLGLNAEKMASIDTRSLKNDLMLNRDLKHDEHLKAIDGLANDLLDLKSLHERTLNISLKENMKKNVDIRESIDRLSAKFDWFPWKQEMLEKSARGLNQREGSKNDHVSLSSNFDWFPWKQEIFKKSTRGVSQSKDRHVNLLSEFDWFPWKQEMLEKSVRGVSQREENKNDHVSLSSNFDWFPWKQEMLKKSARGVSQSKDGHVNLLSDFDWFPWKQEMLEKSSRGVSQREQSKNDQVSKSSDFDWFPWKKGALHDTVRDIHSTLKDSLPGNVISKPQPAKVMRNLDSNLAWDWKMEFYKPMFPENKKMDQHEFIDF